MNVKEFLVKNPSVNEKSFGLFVRQRREELGYTVRGLAKELDMTPAYLSDIEKGNRYAPKNYFEIMRKKLQISNSEKMDFEDLACGSRGNTYPDINPYLGEQPLARVALRKARDKDISNKMWKDIINLIEKHDSGDK